MIILAVDNNPDDLMLLRNAIQAIHPNAQIISFIDPLLAFQYSVFNPVDSLYTAVVMKRLGGFKLERMMREDHPALVVNFIADDTSYWEKSIQHMANSYTVKPVSADKLLAAEQETW